MLTQKTVGVGVTATSFLNVFDWETWILFTISLLSVSIVLLGLYHFSLEKDKRRGVNPNTNEIVFTTSLVLFLLQNIFYTLWGALC